MPDHTITITVDKDWIGRVQHAAFSEHGSNDDEHDLLMDMLDTITDATRAAGIDVPDYDEPEDD